MSVDATAEGAGGQRARPGPTGPTLPGYVEQAGRYEQRTAAFQEWRQRLVEMLPLKRGDVVLDVGCGTGLCLPMAQERVGPEGVVVGIDGSPQMLELARRRARDHDWRNVMLIEAPVEEAEIPVSADAALFCAVHDILRSRSALRRVFRHLRPGAWVAAAGGKWAPPWMVGLNALVYGIHLPFVSSFAGFHRPWSQLEEFVDGLQVLDVASGGGYLALARAKAGPLTGPAAPVPQPAVTPPPAR
jgi:ubiquinone/menaquinone biosynthesis C-methylase UbiE